MHFHELALAGAYQVVPDKHEDERGFFARTACVDEFAAHGLVGQFAQVSISYNKRRGTVRGMHFSVPPDAETKLVRCTAGAIYDVIVDLRPDSKTYLQTHGQELNSENRLSLYIPPGFAHGFQALCDGSEVLYMIDKFHATASQRGVRWNDPKLDVIWPEDVTIISARDLSFPDWDQQS